MKDKGTRQWNPQWDASPGWKDLGEIAGEQTDEDKSESLTSTGGLGHMSPSHVFSSWGTNMSPQ